jgi:hypothetical protein
MRDPELVARAQRAAARLESAWEQWRALHGLAIAPAQPVVSYVGYSLTEPWGEPRVVIGIDADEAEFLADFLDRDECARTAQHAGYEQVGLEQVSVEQALLAEPQSTDGSYSSGTALLGAPVMLGLGPQVADSSTDITAELAGWSSGEIPGQASEQLATWPLPRTPAAPRTSALPRTPQVPRTPHVPRLPPGLTAAEKPPGAA